MKSSITAGLEAQTAQEIKAAFNASARLRERYVTLLEAKIELSRKNARKTDAYDKPSWAYLQADAIGYERAIIELISLLSSDSVTK